jgi:archaellum biogenesis protein FlaJ (TadC family)
MMSSLVSTMASSTLSTTSVISMFATVGVSQISIIAVVSLIALLCASEILSASKHWNNRLSTMLNLAIMPMVLTFVCIVAFKVTEVLR